ncbi:MAG: hypothetical protein K0S47_3127 [Herbinix sp.]|jgi:hypothetical protein|nr:hypothetical protein [Herbinix sp.]
MSKYADQIIRVIEIMKTEVYRITDNGEEVSSEEIHDITRDAFKETAKEFDVTESTIESKCTRDMGISAEEFYGLVRDYLIGNEKELEDKIVDNCKENDNPADVRGAIQKIR